MNLVFLERDRFFAFAILRDCRSSAIAVYGRRGLLVLCSASCDAVKIRAQSKKWWRFVAPTTCLTRGCIASACQEKRRRRKKERKEPGCLHKRFITRNHRLSQLTATKRLYSNISIFIQPCVSDSGMSLPTQPQHQHPLFLHLPLPSISWFRAVGPDVDNKNLLAPSRQPNP